MVAPRPYKSHRGNHALKPETLMLSYGFDPQLSEGAVKPPIFLTSTFVFKTAEEGKDFFDYVSGRRQPPLGGGGGPVPSTRASIIQTVRLWKIVSPYTKAPKPVFFFHLACPQSLRQS